MDENVEKLLRQCLTVSPKARYVSYMKIKVTISKRHINKLLCKHNQNLYSKNQNPQKTKSG